jgi:hypothetical protein
MDLQGFTFGTATQTDNSYSYNKENYTSLVPTSPLLLPACAKFHILNSSLASWTSCPRAVLFPSNVRALRSSHILLILGMAMAATSCL